MIFAQIKWRLLVTYIIVVAVCIGVVIVVVRQVSISSYSQHMQMMGMTMGGEMTGGMASSLDQSFRDALNISLIWGGLAAIVVAVILSLIISRRLTRPIHDMAQVTERIAEGDYSKRVDFRSGDEIGSLARSLNRMAGSLEKSRRLRRELMANIAHELRTPLTSISGYMEALSDEVVPPTPETYDLIHREADRLSRLVDDCQKLSRAESGQQEFDVTSFSAMPFLERINLKLSPQYQDKGVSLDFSVEPEKLELMTDEDKMDQIIVNLLDNALRHTDTGGSISLSCRGKGKVVEFTITDNGSGISPEDLPYIFERFYRADKSRSRNQGGSGIGLTIVKCYVESLGGSIDVESTVNKGTTFTILMPVVPEIAADAGSAP